MTTRAWWFVAIVAAVTLAGAGAGVTYLVMRSGAHGGAASGGEAAAMDHPPAMAADPTPGAPLPDLVITIPEDLVNRAGLVIATVTTGAASSAIRLPGVVMPNAYKQVVVTPLVAGRVTRVSAELGAAVRRGQTLAEVFSPELAEAQSRFTAARAALAAHDRELQRTEKLAAIGAASQEELERAHAAHVAQAADVQSARSRLQLFGMPAGAIDALAAGRQVGAGTAVPAPIDGIVTERFANAGLNVDPAMKLFTVVDLSTVWVIANLAEMDFARARVGSFASVTSPAYPGLVARGRISYIDPQVSAGTRTAEARIEVANPGQRLRLGMFVDAAIETPGDTSVLLIPQSAVQNLGGREVVYLVEPNRPGTFIEREVRLGGRVDGAVEVLAGLKAGDALVAQGSFFIRAERERLGLQPAARRPPAAAAPPAGAAVHTAAVTITDKGFEPSRVTLPAGGTARVTFTRTSEATCATEVVFPSLGIKRALPLNTPVAIDIPAQAGEIAFVCGMDMLRGAVVVQ
ncbi:MAG TPA: efflux RND transporter periplasmic adaptor subunit [Vicinamibacterales bacterium]|nr:efflux RND transporter periplasmic adaptor subunit [Vicinamibacterales bacterium]